MMLITEHNLVALLLNDATRKELFEQLDREQGSQLPLHNQLCHIAPAIVCTEQEFMALQQVLLTCDNKGEEMLSWLLFHPRYPHSALYELLALKKCLSALTHRNGPIDLLLKLINEHDGCDEAILTVGKHYFMCETIDTATFATFVTHHHRHEWLLSSLIYASIPLPKQATEKVAALYEIIEGSPFALQLTALNQELQTIQMLEQTQDPQILTTYAGGNNPAYLRVISNNPHTPLTVLQDLVQVSHLKFSKEIRHNARQLIHAQTHQLNAGEKP